MLLATVAKYIGAEHLIEYGYFDKDDSTEYSHTVLSSFFSASVILKLVWMP
jgi:hypothetical protein